MIVNVIVGIIVFIMGAYVVQKLGETNRGLLAYVVSVGPILATIGGLGTINAFVFFDVKKSGVRKELFLKVLGVVAMALTIIGFCHSLGLYVLSNQNIYLVFASLIIPLSAYFTIKIKTWSLSKNDLLTYFFVSLVQPFCISLVCVFGTLKNFTTTLSFALVLECILVSSLYCYFIRDKFSVLSKSSEKSYFEYSKKNYWSNLATVIYARLDVVLIGFLFGFQTLGLFVIAKSISSQLNLLANSINSLLFGFFMKSDNSNATATFIRILVVLMLLLLPLCLTISVTGPFILSFIFGDRYEDLSELLNILVMSTLIYCISQPFNAKFLSLDLVQLNTKAISYSLLVMLCSMPISYESYGLIGAGYSILLSNFVLLTLRCNYFARSI